MQYLVYLYTEESIETTRMVTMSRCPQVAVRPPGSSYDDDSKSMQARVSVAGLAWRNMESSFVHSLALPIQRCLRKENKKENDKMR